MKKWPISFLLWCVFSAGGLLHAQTHNYSEAFQKALFFYESQASGTLSQDNRVEWRGNSATRDGSDVSRDLSGGWYDAGDGVVWTGNDGFGASMLAWSLVNHRDVYISTGQYQIAIDRLREINAYLEKITQLDSSSNVERLYCGKGSIKNVTPDDPAATNDRTDGCPNELMDTTVGGSPQAIRPSYWVDSTTGGADIAGALAAAFASSSIAFRDYGDTTRANELLALAKKVYDWGEANPNKASVTDHNGTAITTSTATRRLTNGSIVTLGNYASRQSDYTPRMLYAAAWLHRADVSAATSGYTTGWVDKAETIYNSDANSSKRSKSWVSFASGSEQNGAYAMLAADSGRSVFVTEANAYAKFWANDRSADTGRTTDITATPDGFLARGQSAAWNIHTLLDQAPPLLNWADSSYITDATLKANLVSLYTGTYDKCSVKQIDYILGSNSRKLSYLAGYKPADTGYDWVKNLHYRPTWFRYGGFGTPSADQPSWNTATPYGTLAPGPDHTDFYPQTRTLTDSAGTTLGHQEPIIYSGGLLTVLARNIALGGSSAGSVLGTFPTWETRASDYQTTSFFVRASKDNSSKFQCYLNNRASLPPREINTLGFRYYFTPDGVAGSAVSCTATGSGLLTGESVEKSGPFQVGSTTTWYFEFELKDAMIVPGEYSRYKRKVQLEFSQTSGTFDPSNDHSAGSALTSTEATITNMPVYDTSGGTGNWKLLGGFEPTAGYLQWRLAHFNNVMESAGSVVLIAERVGGTTGAVSATVSCASGTATAADYTAPTGSAAVLSWTDGEKGEKTISIPLTADSYKEGREYFTATLGSFTGSATAGINASTRVSIEDDDFNGSLDPGALVQVFGKNTSIADDDTTPSTSDDTDFGDATTSTDTVTRTFTINNLDSTALTLSGSPLVALSGTNAADFSVTTAPDSSVAASGSTTFQIKFSPSDNGDRTATVTLSNNKSTDGTFTFAIKGKGTGAKPAGSISPSSITKELKPGGSTAGSATQSVTLSNTGRASLPWTASLPTKYIAKTSTAANGPAYNWIDITTAGATQGTVVTFPHFTSADGRDDELSGTLDIGFSFPFYGSNRTQFKVSTNGFLTFTTSSNANPYSNYALPSSAFGAATLCPWWDDLYLKANQGDIYYKRVDADTFVVTWSRISYYNGGTPSGDMSFQVLLKRSGQIIFQYKNVMSPVDSTGYTLGVQNDTTDSDQACQYAYNTKTAENGIAIEFRPPPNGSYDVTGTTGNWATLATTSGTAAIQSTSSFNLSLDTTGLISGQSYPTEITVNTPDDPAHTSYTVPVTLTAKQVFNLASSGTSNRVWETTGNWSATTTAFPGPSDDLTLTTAGGSLGIDGPRTINALTLNASAGLTLNGTGFGGSGTGATLTTTGLVSVQQGSLLAGGSTAKLQLNGGLSVSGGTFGFASGATGSITVADSAPVTLSGGILDTLVNTSSTIYRQALGTGDLTLSGTAPEIKVSEDTFTLARRLTGTGGFKKTGSGTLLLNGSAADHSGTTDINAGTLKLGADNVLGGSSALKLSGGTLATNGKTLSIGTLELSANSTIDFSGGGTLVFTDSSALTWAGSTLTITNFTAGTDTLRFGTSNAGITAAQRAKITINGQAATIDANGNVSIPDTTAPIWTSGWPKADTATSTGFTARAQTNEAGTAYYVVLADAATAPTAAQVKAGQNASGSAALASGNIALTANTEGTAAVTGLTTNTAYDVYFVAQDAADTPNLQSSTVKVDISTAANSYSWATDTAGNWADTAKWTPSGTVPNERDITVTFGTVVTVGRTVTLNTNATVGNLVFNEDAVTQNSYTVAFNANQTLTFDVTTGNATINARGLGGYQIGTQGSGSIQLADTLAISAGANGNATGESGTVVLNSQVTGSGGLLLTSLNSNDGSGTAVSGSRGTSLRSTVANTFSGGVTVNSGYVKLVGNIGNLGSGTLTLNSSDATNGGQGTNLALRTGGGTLTNPITLGNGVTSGSPQIVFNLEDSTASTYTFTGALTGTVASLSPRFNNSVTAANASTLIFNGDGSGLTTTSTQWQIRMGKIQLGHANALGTGNGNGSNGRYLLGNFSNGSNGVAALLSNGVNIGGNITTNQANGSGNTSGDNLVLGGTHTTGSATYSGTVQIGRIVGGTRQLQLTGASGGTTVFSGILSDAAVSGSASTFVPVYKVDAGTVSLTAANTYSGTTTVSAGTLLANNPSGSATGTGTVTVASGASFGGTGTITGALTIADGGKLTFALSTAPASHDRLDVGAVTLSGASSVVITASGSAPTTGAFTLLRSTGNLTGTVPTLTLPAGYTGTLAFSGTDLVLTLTQVPFDNWAAESGLTGSNALATADPDGDGIANLLEYALGTAPDSAASRPILASQISNSKLQITFTPQRSDVTYTVEASSDLATWTALTMPALTVGQSATVTDTVELTAGTKRFLRLKVSQP